MRHMKKLIKFINRITISRASDRKDCYQPKDVKSDSFVSARPDEASPVFR